MFIEIEDLKAEPLHVHHVFPIDEIGFSHEDASLSSGVTVDFVLTHHDRELRIDGTVETTITFSCSRCTRECDRPFFARFGLFYQPQPDWGARGAEVELKYEDMEVGYYDGVTFDVNAMVLEQIELAIPMKVVCREDCQGLCDQCGADLNEGACHCSREELDSRLSVLLDFRKKNERKED